MEFKDRFYLILAGIFIASLVSCNLIFQKFFTWTPFGLYTFELSVGILPYPITFLVTDLISELYGKKKADQVVISGLIASVFVMGVVLLANYVPNTPWSPVNNELFEKVFGLQGPAVFASMIAYLSAQFIDVRVFHFWKKLTKGKHLWLRNNGSTFVSQFVDTAAVLILLCSAGVIEWSRFLPLLENGFLFKIMVALIDTPIIYGVIHLLKGKIEIAKY
ncbi:MAG: queuosine precursor transporter [Candidatus Neomarinimicrobiota bacterium]